MGDLKTRLSNARTKLLRRPSAQGHPKAAAATRSLASSAGSERPRNGQASSLRKSVSLTKLPEISSTDVNTDDDEQQLQQLSKSAVLPSRRSNSPLEGADGRIEDGLISKDRRSHEHTSTTNTAPPTPAAPQQPPTEIPTAHPAVVLEEPTPIPVPVDPGELAKEPIDAAAEPGVDLEYPSELPPSRSSKPTPPGIVRRQSLVTTSNARIIKTLLDSEPTGPGVTPGIPTADYLGGGPVTFNAGMLHRKIWVKRPNASATLVQIREDDLVDDVRDMILKKYANSLGRSFDAPDVTLRICPRADNNNNSHHSKHGERTLGPEEEMCRTLDAYYPGGQTVNEALVIDVPQRRTPKPSPRVPVYYSHHDDSRPYEASSEYFPPMPIINPSPAAMTSVSHETRVSLPHAPHSIAVLSTGQLPPLPSPGSTRRHHNRPKYPRHNTASPTTIMAASLPVSSARPPQRPRHDSSASETKHSATSNGPLPTPPAATDAIVRQGSSPPTPRVASPRPDAKKRKKLKGVDAPSLPAGLLDGSVPPINVLIVEDNIINLRVLGAFMQRLKVRWQRAMNGREAVTKWRAGGFHLVLMDIQLPIMNGLDATKEIRRLERVNNIGVFSSGSNEAPNNRLGDDGKQEKEIAEEDKLGDRNMFKSPVIIVALTASSLQSDRHEALAAGCNDFLTKPVNFVWLERKVKEWGCMQALIDFDGWRKWKDFAAQSETNDGASKLSNSVSSKGRGKNSLSAASGNSSEAKAGSSSANGVLTSGKPKDEERKNKRRSLGVVPAPLLEEESLSPSPTPPHDL